jgi:hypothetical protein
MVAALAGAAKFDRLSMFAVAAPTSEPVFHAAAIPPTLQEEFVHKSFKLDAASGNYLGPRLYSRTVHEPMVPVMIDGRYVRDVRGQTLFLRGTIRDKLLVADAAMFKHKKQHIKIVYGYRPNALQYELYLKLNGHGKVAPAGMSFHETGMALDLSNWREAQGYMIDAGFVGGCFGLEEDMVHYSVNEITKASNVEEFKRCTFKEIPEDVLKAAKKVGIEGEKVGDIITFGHFPGSKKTQQ